MAGKLLPLHNSNVLFPLFAQGSLSLSVAIEGLSRVQRDGFSSLSTASLISQVNNFTRSIGSNQKDAFHLPLIIGCSLAVALAFAILTLFALSAISSVDS